MTSKEKANELLDRFVSSGYYESFGEMQFSNTTPKNYAIFCVNQIIAVMQDIWLDSFIEGESDNKFYNYWNDVKKEIEKL